MDVDDAALIGLEKGFPDDAHIARQAHQVDVLGVQHLHDLRLEGSLVGIGLGREDERVDTVAGRLLDDGRTGLVAHHHGHLGIQDAVGAGAGDGLEVRAGSAREYR